MTQVAPFFAEMESYIATSRQKIAAGKDIELKGLDEKIEALCNLIISLSPEEQNLYQGRLEDLLGDLNSLGNELKTQMDGFKDLPTHRHANVAYKTADSRDNFGKRDEKKDEK